jgi:hypothetical protein
MRTNIRSYLTEPRKKIYQCSTDFTTMEEKQTKANQMENSAFSTTSKRTHKRLTDSDIIRVAYVQASETRHSDLSAGLQIILHIWIDTYSLQDFSRKRKVFPKNA